MFIEWFSALGTMIAAGAAVVAARIASTTLKQSRIEQQQGLIRQKKQATIDAYNRLQDDVLDKLNQYAPAEIRKIAEDNHSDEFKKLGGYVARIEHFCVGLETDIYDYETFYRLAHGYFDNKTGMLRLRIEPILGKKLARTKDDYYAHIHAVWAKMKEMEKNSGKV